MWTKEWPTEAGFYWFYGFLWYRYYRDGDKPELVSVEGILASNGIMYVAKGAFIYKSEKHIGFWHKADLPELPSHSELMDLILISASA